MNKKTFIGKGKSIQTKFGKMHKVGIPQDQFEKYAKNGWLNLMVKFNQEGNIYLELDEWEPNKALSNKSEQVSKVDDDIPF